MVENNPLSLQNKEDIEAMLFGPFKPEWRDEKGRIINSDRAIAERINIKISTVSNYSTKLLVDHFKKLKI
jgi:hypothetical protein